MTGFIVLSIIIKLLIYTLRNKSHRNHDPILQEQEHPLENINLLILPKSVNIYALQLQAEIHNELALTTSCGAMIIPMYVIGWLCKWIPRSWQTLKVQKDAKFGMRNENYVKQIQKNSLTLNALIYLLEIKNGRDKSIQRQNRLQKNRKLGENTSTNENKTMMKSVK